MPPGRYRLSLDLVAEGRSWFSDLGNAPLELEAEVAPRLTRRALAVDLRPGPRSCASDPGRARRAGGAARPGRGGGGRRAPRRPAAGRHPTGRAGILDAHAEGFACVGGSIEPVGGLLARAGRRQPTLAPWAPEGGRKPGLRAPAALPLARSSASCPSGSEVGGLPALHAPARAVDLRRQDPRQRSRVRQALLTILRCPVCGGAVEPDEFPEEMEQGTLHCLSCGESSRSSAGCRSCSATAFRASPRRSARSAAGWRRRRARTGTSPRRRSTRNLPFVCRRARLGRSRLGVERVLVLALPRPLGAAGAAECSRSARRRAGPRSTSSRAGANTSPPTSWTTTTSGSAAARSSPSASGTTSASRPTASISPSPTARSTSPSAWPRSTTRSTCPRWSRRCRA